MLAVLIWYLVCYGAAEGASTTTAVDETSNINSLPPPPTTSTSNSLLSATVATLSTNSLPSATTTTSRNKITTTTKPTSTPRNGKHRFCYQCSASSEDEPCVTDTGGMANISTRDIYIKDCTDSNPEWDRCMIQTVEAGGKLLFYHRDCHDGRYFPKTYDSERFHNISANNLTTCDLIVDKLVCYTPCRGNLCNGPKTYVNKTDYCLLYRDSLYENVTLPPGIECGSLGLHVQTKQVALLATSLVATFMFGNVVKLLSYL